MWRKQNYNFLVHAQEIWQSLLICIIKKTKLMRFYDQSEWLWSETLLFDRSTLEVERKNITRNIASHEIYAKSSSTRQLDFTLKTHQKCGQVATTPWIQIVPQDKKAVEDVSASITKIIILLLLVIQGDSLKHGFVVQCTELCQSTLIQLFCQQHSSTGRLQTCSLLSCQWRGNSHMLFHVSVLVLHPVLP